MSEQTPGPGAVFVCRVNGADGIKDYVTLLPLEVAFKRGLAPEAVVGALLRPLEPGESIAPENFARNRFFVELLHRVVAQYAPDQEGGRAEARRIGEGWLYVIDARTPTPQGAIPPEDLLGAFQVEGGEIVEGSYQRNPNHMILTQHGFFQLDAGVHECLVREMSKHNSSESPPENPSSGT